MRSKVTRRLLFLTVPLFGACNWLPVTPEGEQVRVESAQAVANCQHKGTVNVTVKDRFGIIKRGPDIVAEELVTLARNDAANMGGNTVVAETPIQDGRQTYGIYVCRR